MSLLCVGVCCTVAGRRTVPVETGDTYLSESSGQTLMTINQFIDEYILKAADKYISDGNTDEEVLWSRGQRGKPSFDLFSQDTPSRESPSKRLRVNDEVSMGYIAQHGLFDQIPSMREDFAIPDFCAMLQPDEEDAIAGGGTGEAGDGVISNAWFGPVGTVSPLHHDPYHNILAQVHGAFQKTSHVMYTFHRIN